MKGAHYSIRLAQLLLTLVLAQVGIATAQTKKPEAVKIIDGPRVENVGETTAIIAWTTNTGGSSIVRYDAADDEPDRSGSGGRAWGERGRRATAASPVLRLVRRRHTSAPENCKYRKK